MKWHFRLHRESPGFWVRRYVTRAAVVAALVALAAWAVWLSFESARVRREQDAIALVKQVGGTITFPNTVSPHPFRWLPPADVERALRPSGEMSIVLPEMLSASFTELLAKMPVEPSEVRVGGRLLGDESLKALLRFENLRNLDLSPAPHLSNDGAKAIARLTELRELNVSGSEIDDFGAYYVGTLTHLESLDISATRVTDAGLARLSGLTELRMLVLGSANNWGIGRWRGVRIPARDSSRWRRCRSWKNSISNRPASTTRDCGTWPGLRT